MPRRRRRPASSLDPEIRDRIERLASSWPLQQARGVRCPSIDPCPANWQQVFEEKYGDGDNRNNRAERYQARRAELNDLLFYKAGVDLEATVRILETARQAEEHHARDMKQHRPYLRAVHTRREVIRNLLIETYQGFGADERQAGEITDRGLAHFPGLNGTFPFPTGDHRLDKNPPKPWVKAARAALRTENFTMPESNKLLMAIGVIRPRPSRRARVKSPR